LRILVFLGFWFSFWFRSCLNGFHRHFATQQLNCFTAAGLLNYNDKPAFFTLVFFTFLCQKLTPAIERQHIFCSHSDINVSKIRRNTLKIILVQEIQETHEKTAPNNYSDSYSGACDWLRRTCFAERQTCGHYASKLHL
jgi:hypothetical protein